MAGGGLVAMVVVQKWGGAREGRSAGERSSEHHGPRGGAIKITKSGCSGAILRLYAHELTYINNKC